MKRIKFTKMAASGNDFIVVDSFEPQLLDLSSTAQRVCERKRGIGADGLLVIEDSQDADFKMRIFNPDGSEAEMCGNGARCAALWGSSKFSRKGDRQVQSSKLSIETRAGIIEAEVVGDERVRLKLSLPKDFRTGFSFDIDGKIFKADYINTGVPHLIVAVEELEGLDVKRLGSTLRYRTEFSPEGTNVDFVKAIDEKTFQIRTYERGVEDETFACGTGVTAAAVIGYKRGLVQARSIDIKTEGGELLTVDLQMNGEDISEVYLEGDARAVYDGEIEL